MVVFFALVAAVIVAACEEPLAPPAIAHIKGRLTLNGKPLRPGHSVVFMEPHAGHLAYGTTDDNGKFVVNSWKNGDMVPGRYKAYIAPPTPDENLDDRAGIDVLEVPPAKPLAPIEFPERYRVMESSGLEFAFVPGENEVVVNLTDEPAPASNSAPTDRR